MRAEILHPSDDRVVIGPRGRTDALLERVGAIVPLREHDETRARRLDDLAPVLDGEALALLREAVDAEEDDVRVDAEQAAGREARPPDDEHTPSVVLDDQRVASSGAIRERRHRRTQWDVDVAGDRVVAREIRRGRHRHDLEAVVDDDVAVLEVAQAPLRNRGPARDHHERRRSRDVRVGARRDDRDVHRAIEGRVRGQHGEQLLRAGHSQRGVDARGVRRDGAAQHLLARKAREVRVDEDRRGAVAEQDGAIPHPARVELMRRYRCCTAGVPPPHRGHRHGEQRRDRDPGQAAREQPAFARRAIHRRAL